MDQAELCQEHFEPIILLDDDDNINWCLTCIEIKCYNNLVNVEEFTDEYQEILDNQCNEDEIVTLEKILDLIKKYKQLLNNSQNERKYNQMIIQIDDSNNQNSQKFNYKLINEYPNNKDCYSFVFNQDSTRLFIGQKYDIQVYEFKNGEMKILLQTLKYHSNWIYCLIYMNKFNLLVSGSWDRSIVIWNQNQYGSWRLQQILKEHKNVICCLINNEDEDLLISGSDDYTIKFWRKTNMNWSCQQTIQTKFKVYSLSLSKSQTKLISCGFSELIYVMEQKSDQQWIISQTINTNNIIGQHVLFLSENQFVYQGKQDYLQIYLYDQEQKQFIQDKQINVQKYNGCINLFPCKYIEQKNIFIIKNGRFLNCFRIDQQQNYILQQSIEYHNLFIGYISNDGQYLITRQYFQNTIEIRELQYLE